MSTHHYPLTVLYRDYLRVALGLALTVGPLLLLDLATMVAWLLASLALLFGWFGLRTALRHMSWIEISPAAIAVHGPMGRRLAWDQVAGMKLAYYAPRRSVSSSRRTGQHEERNSPSGWLQLTLRSAEGSVVRVESTLDGFDQVLHRAMATVVHKQLDLDPTTQANLAALGVDRKGSARAEPTPAPSNGLAASPRPKGSL